MQRARIDLLILAALALTCNFAYFAASNGDFFFPDSNTYIAPAQSMLAGHGFMRDGHTPETFRTPGYPLFLMPFIAVSPRFEPIVVVQHILDALLAIAVYLFTRGRFSRFTAFVAAALVAVDLPSIHYANKVLSETLFTIVLFAIVWHVSESERRPLLAGLLCGALVLIRPAAVAWFVVLAVLFAFRRRRAIALFVAAALLLPLGWMARNGMRTGVFALADVAGVNMLLHRAAPALAILDDYEFREALRDRQDELTSLADDEIEQRYHLDPVELNPAQHAKYFGLIGRRIAVHHPLGLTLLHLRGILVNLFDSDWESLAIVSRVPETLVETALVAWTHAVTLLALFGLIALRRRDPHLSALFALTIAYFVFVSAGSEAEARFRVPITPLIAIAAAVGVDALRDATRRRPA